MRYFTSDFHLGSANINKYAHRPFASAEEALASLLANVNGNLARHDTLIHVGDFMLAGKDRHGKDEDVGLKYKLDDYLDMFEPSVILLNGNHDNGHNCEAAAKSMMIDLNQNYRNVYVSHYPSTNLFYKGPRCLRYGNKHDVGVVLCGHVHDSWLLEYDHELNILNINVGVDVWDYKPVHDARITQLLDTVFMITEKCPHIWKNDWNWKKTDLKNRVEQYEALIKQGREARKQERYAKKGLTPEECQRRKEAAMKAKGLK